LLKIMKLRIEKNKIIDTDGREIVLNGININSPCILKFQENHDFLEDIRQIKKLGANAVSIPVCPAYFQSRDNYCEEILDTIIQTCKDLNLHCLLDWHAQGNPIKGATRDPKNFIDGYLKYDANLDIATKSAEILSSRYKNEPNVIFNPFSAFLESGRNDYLEATKILLKIIRKNTDSIVIISAVDWPQSLKYAPFEELRPEKNIAYGIMLYFGENLGEEKKNIIKIKEKGYPVIITEWGYQKNNPKEKEMSGGVDDYAKPIGDFISRNKINSFAWCYHPTRQPCLLNSWNPNDLSEWGMFLKEWLNNLKTGM